MEINLELVSKSYAMEGITVLDCREINETTYEIEFFEACGGGYSSVGEFEVSSEELINRINNL